MICFIWVLSLAHAHDVIFLLHYLFYPTANCINFSFFSKPYSFTSQLKISNYLLVSEQCLTHQQCSVSQCSLVRSHGPPDNVAEVDYSREQGDLVFQLELELFTCFFPMYTSIATISETYSTVMTVNTNETIFV